jgi:hypothetical protein
MDAVIRGNFCARSSGTENWHFAPETPRATTRLAWHSATVWRTGAGAAVTAVPANWRIPRQCRLGGYGDLASALRMLSKAQNHPRGILQ